MWAAPQRVKKPGIDQEGAKDNGGARGGTALLELDPMPRSALPCKACGERSEDFCAPKGHERNGIFTGCQKSPRTFLTAWGAAHVGGLFLLLGTGILRRRQSFPQKFIKNREKVLDNYRGIQYDN